MEMKVYFMINTALNILNYYEPENLRKINSSIITSYESTCTSYQINNFLTYLFRRH